MVPAGPMAHPIPTAFVMLDGYGWSLTVASAGDTDVANAGYAIPGGLVRAGSICSQAYISDAIGRQDTSRKV